MDLLRVCTLLALVSFGLHFAWEFSHVRLYTDYTHWSGSIPVYYLATLGDVLYTLGAFALVSAFKKTYDWLRDATFSDYLMLVTLGFLIALFVEYKGLALERWQYVSDMPVIPVLGVGLSPIVEMSLLLPLSFFITAFLERVLSRDVIPR